MDDLHDRTLQALVAAIRSFDPIRFRIWAELGLTLPQARVLFILAEEGDYTTGQLADRLNVSPPTMTGIADRLVRQRLIERAADPTDRRVVRLGLTEHGRRIATEHSEIGRAYVSSILNEMSSDQIIALTEALETFVAAYERTRWQSQTKASG